MTSFIMRMPLAFLLAVVIFGVTITYASTTSINIGGSPDVLYIQLDLTGETSDMNYTLPSVVGNDGDMYLFKLIDPNATYRYNIYPASNETIEGDQTDIAIWNDGDYLTLIADETNSTWRIINVGSSGL